MMRSTSIRNDVLSLQPCNRGDKKNISGKRLNNQSDTIYKDKPFC